ncbi:Rxlr effector protein [Globisporangium polare]
MSAPQLKVTYFHGAGRAELTRLLLTFGGVEFVDERIEGADFPALKPTLPLGQLPTITVNGTIYSQSMAMARYAAKIAGLYPSNPEHALRADMVSETLCDLMNSFIAIVFVEKDEAVKAEKTKTFIDEAVPKALAALESMVQGKFFLGDSASYADVHLFDLFVNGLKPRFPDLSTAAYPKLEAVMESVKSNANVVAYHAKHQK